MRSELKRIRYRHEYVRTLRSTFFSLLVVAVLILAAVVFLPVIRITGDSMATTLNRGDILITRRGDQVEKGDLIVFYTANRKMLVKRVIAMSGDVVEIAENGALMLNGQAQEEAYVSREALGECDIEFPYTVPEGRVFVMGDDREVSLDSRSTAIGCVAQEQIIGKAALRIWPLETMGFIGND